MLRAFTASIANSYARRLTAFALLAACLLACAGCGSISAPDTAADRAGYETGAAPRHDAGEADSGQASAGRAAGNSAGSAEDQPASGGSKPGNRYETAGIDDPSAFEAMFDQLKEAVAAGSKKKVAKFVLYPLNVNDPKGMTKINSSEDFIGAYDSIMTDDVKKALDAQTTEGLFVNYKGVMVGDGELWLGTTAGTPQKYGIVAVNIMPPAS